MALFGSLQDLPLAELLPILRGRTGVLEVLLPARPKVGVALREGRIQEVREGKRVLDPLEARALLMELLDHREGSFEFQPGPVERGLDWPVERFLLLSVTVADEIQGYRDALPHPRTRFALKRGVREDLLDEPLLSFWRRAKEHLETPTSVEDLARLLHLPQDQTAYYLHKLRLLGLVEVGRALERQRGQEERRGLFERLFQGVRKLLGGEG